MTKPPRDILSRVFLNLKRFLPAKVCVAFSGGADSLFLLYILKEILDSTLLSAVHINHGIRGVESDADEKFCRKICADWSIPLHVFHTDVPALVKKQGISMEMAARDQRYKFFEKVHNQDSETLIATAHHLDDLAETVLLRLFKGTGPAGLIGIREKRDFVFRPLLPFSKQEILTVLKELELTFQTDSSNLEIYAERNYLRQDVIPLIQKRFPAFRRKIWELKLILEEENQFFESRFQKFKGIKLKNEEELVLSKTQILENFPHPAVQVRLLRFWMKQWMPELNLDFASFRHLRSFLNRTNGSNLLYQNKTMEIFSIYEKLLFRKVHKQPQKPPRKTLKLKIPSQWGSIGNYKVRVAPTRQNENKEIDFSVNVDLEKISTLTVRHWHNGDRICIGHNAHKTLQDFFVDSKLARFQREQSLVFCDPTGKIIAIFAESFGFRRAYNAELSQNANKYEIRIIKNEEARNAVTKLSF